MNVAPIKLPLPAHILIRIGFTIWKPRITAGVESVFFQIFRWNQGQVFTSE